MKKISLIAIIICLLVIMTGCNSNDAVEAEDVRSVKVEKVSPKTGNEILEYVGVVASKDITKYSFKTPGAIEKIYVSEGDRINKGDKIAKLDISELNFALDGSTATLDAAKYQVTQAKDAYNYDKNNLENMKKLLDEGAISKDTYDKLNLKVNVSYENYKQAKEKVTGLKADLEHKKFLLENATLVSDIGGFVVKVLYKENEQVAPFYPVIVVRSEEQIVNVGVSQRDIDKVNIGTEAIIDFYDKSTKGKVINIADSPDTDTRTYNVEISLEENKYKLGEITKVKLNIGELSGIWVPINSILSDGEDYVYVIKDGRAFKQMVNIVQLDNGRMMVDGLEEGQEVVVDGMKNLLDGMLVNVTVNDTL